MKRNWALLLIVALMLCLLPGTTREAAAESKVLLKNACVNCKEFREFELIRYLPTPISSTPDPVAHWVEGKCTKCENIQQWVPDDPSRFHTGGTETPTCTTGKTCEKCGAQYGILGHDWGQWQSSGDNKTHTRPCLREGCDAIDTAHCGGDSSATCVALGTCATCGGQYYSGHTFPVRWKWYSDTDVGRNAETHWVRCLNCTEGKAHEAAHTFAHGMMYLKSKANCVSPAVYYENCSTCYYQGTETYTDPYYGTDPDNHDIAQYPAQAPTCTEPGWDAYEACRREGCDYTTKVEIPANGHDKVHHEAKAATCTEIGWEAYDTCKNCDYTTYAEIPAPGHDLEHHEAKAATCTEIGWNAYDTCKKCDYTTYVEIPAAGHDLEHHEAKAATCTEIGWEAYDTCKKCDYTTYVELPALGHDYQKTVVKPTCEKDGYTRFTCTRCQDTYTENSVKKLYHWFGEWAPNADNTHSANCLRKGCGHIGKTDCQKFEFIAAENESLIFCPVCGQVENGTRLERIEKAMAVAETGKLPAGELIARMNDAYLSLAFEYASKVATPTGRVKITLPAELLAGKTLTRIALDGTETEVSVEVKDGEASFTLDFTADEIPVILIRLTDAA